MSQQTFEEFSHFWSEQLRNYNIGHDGKGISETSTDLHRPWGGFYVIDADDIEKFVDVYFGDTDYEYNPALPIVGKILMAKPNQRLSWQYHKLRSEYWKALTDHVGYYSSETDEPGELKLLPKGQTVRLGVEERHRMVSTDGLAAFAEVWQHADPDNLSSENEDIYRITDDYNRS